MESSQSPEPGDSLLGKYRPLVELGQGGTANVYLAVAHGLSGFNKLVVLKVLKNELSNESDFRRMFMNEARLAGKLNHPNIVQTYEVFEEGGRPVIVMEYLEGQPLSRITARDDGRAVLPMSMHLRIICEALSGLHHAHELTDFDGTPLGVVHRDMTPHNVFASFEGKITILDFGIAKLQNAGHETHTGVIKGKMRYMPPEQIMGDMVDRRADIFAVGVMIWEAATGEKMWRGATDAAIMQAVINGKIPAPSVVRPDVPPALEAICMKALAAEREDRYSTAAELQAELERFLTSLGGEPVTARTIGQFINTQFPDLRARTKKLIERQLSKAKDVEAAKPLDEWMLPAATVTPSRNTPSRPTTFARLRGRGLLFWSVPLLIAAAGAFAILRALPARSTTGTSPVTATEAPPPPRPAPTTEPTPAAPAEVTIRFSANPTSAKLFLDDVPLEANPYVKTLPVDSTAHLLRAEAAGYDPETRAINFTQNTEVSLSLNRAKQRASTPSRPAPQPRPTATGTPKKPNCDPPYVIDESGFRRFKPECL